MDSLPLGLAPLASFSHQPPFFQGAQNKKHLIPVKIPMLLQELCGHIKYDFRKGHGLIK